MSERSPKDNPEKERFAPLNESCDNCEAQYVLDNENTDFIVYEKDRPFNHIICTCPACENKSLYFMDDAYQNHALGVGLIPMEAAKYAPEQLIKMWEQLRGIEIVQPVEISPRHEQQIQKFGETVSAMLEQDPDGFWEDMNSPHDRPYPKKWC